MRINYFQYHDKSLEWRLEKVHFANLTLLVGISGVGKSQILDSVWRVKSIAEGKSLNGINWDISFSTESGEYYWSGAFETKELMGDVDPVFGNGFSDESETDKPRIQFEELSREGENIIRRTASEILLRQEKTPKLSPYESVLSILSEEEGIAAAHDAFKKIIYSDQSDSKFFRIKLVEFKKMLSRYTDLEGIRESGLDTYIKLALAYNNAPEAFNKIKERFIDVFPQVEDVKLEPIKESNFHVLLDEYPMLQIKEKGVRNWIKPNYLSSGMFRTIMHISDMLLSPEGTVFLIDEFENSLGVNCLDLLTEDLLRENRSLQFIVTSHHPYIINNISPNHWKVVTRKGGLVRAYDASKLKLDKSSHKAFIQLINLDEYKEGIEVA